MYWDVIEQYTVTLESQSDSQLPALIGESGVIKLLIFCLWLSSCLLLLLELLNMLGGYRKYTYVM